MFSVVQLLLGNPHVNFNFGHFSPYNFLVELHKLSILKVSWNKECKILYERKKDTTYKLYWS